MVTVKEIGVFKHDSKSEQYCKTQEPSFNLIGDSLGHSSDFI